MPFRYANREDVLQGLSIDEGDTAVIEQVERIENALASAFDQRTGRSFGDAPVASTRTVAVGSGHCLAILTRPAREIIGVTHGGRYNGVTWEGEIVEESWIQRLDGDGRIYAIERNGGDWPASIRVNAVWADDVAIEVPDDVSSALTWLTIRQYRRITASPHELVGPEGFTVPTPHAWDDPTVKDILAKYRVVEVIV